MSDRVIAIGPMMFWKLLVLWMAQACGWQTLVIRSRDSVVGLPTDQVVGQTDSVLNQHRAYKRLLGVEAHFDVIGWRAAVEWLLNLADRIDEGRQTENDLAFDLLMTLVFEIRSVPSALQLARAYERLNKIADRISRFGPPSMATTGAARSMRSQPKSGTGSPNVANRTERLRQWLEEQGVEFISIGQFVLAVHESTVTVTNRLFQVSEVSMVLFLGAESSGRQKTQFIKRVGHPFPIATLRDFLERLEEYWELEGETLLIPPRRGTELGREQLIDAVKMCVEGIVPTG